LFSDKTSAFLTSGINLQHLLSAAFQAVFTRGDVQLSHSRAVSSSCRAFPSLHSVNELLQLAARPLVSACSSGKGSKSWLQM